MKKVAWGVGLMAVMLCFTTASAQFKTSVEPRSTVSESILRSDNGSFLFGLFNPDNFSMHHSFSLSYQTFGNQGISMGMYTNSLAYKFSDDLDVNADISLMASPYNTLGKQYQSGLNGLFLNRAELNYRPWKNTVFQLQFQQVPAGNMMGSGFLGGSYFYGGLNRYQDDIH
jgi:hypothetical protein